VGEHALVLARIGVDLAPVRSVFATYAALASRRWRREGRRLLRGSGDLDLARLRLLCDRDDQTQHAGLVDGFDPIEVEIVPQDDLMAEPMTTLLRNTTGDAPTRCFPLLSARSSTSRSY
jgi:hypothetical protein